MDALAPILIGSLFAAGVYNILRRSLIRILIGFSLVSHSANLLVFSSGGLRRGEPPVIPDGADLPPAGFMDPLPQALVLTAIVIGFGLTGFLAALVVAANRKIGSDDADALQEERP
jgi:multicomponent Na+:H+ antiporter subunit C